MSCSIRLELWSESEWNVCCGLLWCMRVLMSSAVFIITSIIEIYIYQENYNGELSESLYPGVKFIQQWSLLICSISVLPFLTSENQHTVSFFIFTFKSNQVRKPRVGRHGISEVLPWGVLGLECNNDKSGSGARQRRNAFLALELNYCKNLKLQVPYLYKCWNISPHFIELEWILNEIIQENNLVWSPVLYKYPLHISYENTWVSLSANCERVLKLEFEPRQKLSLIL